jgi:hypothetical protein
MQADSVSRGAGPSRLALWRELLRLAAELRELGNPLDSPDDFADLVDLAARFAVLLGVDPLLLERWADWLTDEDLATAVLAVARLLLRLRGER